MYGGHFDIREFQTKKILKPNNHCIQLSMTKERGLKALVSGSLVITRFHPILSQTEKELELEIKRDNQKPRTRIEKAQRTGQKLVESKPVLFFIVILNVIDCILVLGELILDMYYVKGLLESSQASTQAFITDMKSLYPKELSAITITNVEPLFQEIRHAYIDWNGQHIFDASAVTNLTPNNGTVNDCIMRLTGVPTITTASTLNIIRQRTDGTTTAANYTDGPRVNRSAAESSSTNGTHIELTLLNDFNETIVEAENMKVELTHAFHKTSISILAVLTIEGVFKIFSYGRIFIKRRLEVFDFIITLGSLVVDILFFNGISAYEVQRFVIILAFLVPWRVIRVVNSLLVAVMDHEHFRLKLLYKQKKEVSNELKKSKSEAKNLEQCLNNIMRLAKAAGINEETVLQNLTAQGIFIDKSVNKSPSPLHFNKSFPFLHQNSPLFLKKLFSSKDQSGLILNHSFPFLREKSTDSMMSESPSDVQIDIKGTEDDGDPIETDTLRNKDLSECIGSDISFDPGVDSECPDALSNPSDVLNVHKDSDSI